MNASEKITAAEPMNAAHEILMKAASGMCSQEIAAAITGTPRPTKPQIKAAEKMLKAIHDCGMLASQPGRGGVALYSLTTPVCNINKMGDVSLIDEGETSEVCDLAQTGGDSQTSAVIGDSEGGETDAPPISDAQCTEIGAMNAAVSWPGQDVGAAVRIAELEATIALLRETLAVAAEDVSRLSAELETERQAREALQERADVVDAEFVAPCLNAKGYALKVPKRPMRSFGKEETAKSAAMAAARASGRGEVFALIPVGVARKGAEWRNA